VDPHGPRRDGSPGNAGAIVGTGEASRASGPSMTTALPRAPATTARPARHTEGASRWAPHAAIRPSPVAPPWPVLAPEASG
jgi:hypothetical protein